MISNRIPVVALALGATFLAYTPDAAVAQDAGGQSEGASAGSAAAIMPAGSPRPEQGIPFEGWMVYPSFFGGYVYNDNVYETAQNRVGQSGLRLSPSVEASQDLGLHKNVVSLGVDAQLYPSASGQTRDALGLPVQIHDPNPSNATGHATVSHIWVPTEDISVFLSASYVRQNGLFGASPATNGFGVGLPGLSSYLLSPAYIPTIGTFSTQQQYSNVSTASFSVEKRVNERISLRGSVYGSYIWYDSVPSETQYANGVPVQTSSGNGENGASMGASVRGSFYVTPQIYVYAEPGVDLRRYNNWEADSNGYRATAGIGSEMISLFKGEIYGGYQGQTSVHGYYGSQSAPTFGARVFYFPTPDLTFTLYGTSALGVVQPTYANGLYLTGYAGSQASVSVTNQVMLQGDYVVNNYLTLSGRGGWGETRSTAPNFATDVWSAGASLSYAFWRNTSVLLTYDYQQTTSHQSVASALISGTQQGFAQNVFSAGLRYSY